MAEPGEINRNEQKLVRKTNQPGTDHNQYIWVLRCKRKVNGDECGYVYGANGSDFHERKCPKCQGGSKGLVFDQTVECTHTTEEQTCKDGPFAILA